jgi:protein-L-isoaspartate(D-aspartate) O-methyltransferase
LADFATRRMMMVDTQVRPSDVTKFPIIAAMLNVPRERFVPSARRDTAYAGDHVPLAQGRVLLDPRTFAKMLDAIDIQPGDVVLDVGCGLGYSTAVLARMADFVVGVEDDGARADEAQALLSEIGCDNAAIVTGPLTAGAPKSAPYDAVLVNGAVEQVPPALIAQMNDGGRIACIWAEGMLGTARVGHLSGGRVAWRPVFNASAPVLAGFATTTAFAL